MNKSKMRNKGSIKYYHKKRSGTRKINSGEIRRDVEAFLTTSGLGAVYKLTAALENLHIPPHIIKGVVKDAIKDNIKRYNDEADDSGATLKYGYSDALTGFDSDGFIDRKWQYIPFILKTRDYLDIQRKKKYPIFIEQYDYSMPLYTFKNNINFQTEEKFRKRNIHNSNDVQFFISSDEKMLFSKVTNLIFVPTSPAVLREYKKLHPSKQEQEKLIYMPSVYDRSFSISMYVMLEGDPKKTHMYMRYDSSNKSHRNVYIGPDKRERVFGYETGNPHFHFQNEDDNLLCMKKFRDEHRQIKWKTGRCNAIDVKHLVSYLTELDNISEKKVAQQFFEGAHYNMPFLEAKFNKKVFYTKSINAIVDDYKNGKDNHEYLQGLVQKFKLLNPEQTAAGKCFARLISSLKFLQFIYDERINTSDLGELEALSQLEIVCANDVMNSITNSREQAMQKNCQPKYVMKGDYLVKKSSDKTKPPQEKDEKLDADEIVIGGGE